MSGFDALVHYFAEVEPQLLDELEVGIRRQAEREGSGPDDFLDEIRRGARLRLIAEARQNVQ